MHLSGFADEAGPEPETQVRACRALGWRHLEARRLGSANLHDIDDAEFDRASGVLRDAGIQVDCLGTAIANWATPIDQPGDATDAQVGRAIARARRLGTVQVRIMSFALRRDGAGRLLAEQMEAERFARLRAIVRRLRDAGLQPLHENCMNWGGLGASYTLRLLAEVPGMDLVFDTGNPTQSEDHDVPADAAGRRPRQSAWDFYRRVRERIARVHIKDGVFDPVTGTHRHTMPGDGQGDVRAIVRDLVGGGYAGAFSIEPHLAAIHHEPGREAGPEARFAAYVAYGRAMARILDEARAAAATAAAGG